MNRATLAVALSALAASDAFANDDLDFYRFSVPYYSHFNFFVDLCCAYKSGKRFTIFDIDPATATQWAATMQQWASAQGNQ